MINKDKWINSIPKASNNNVEGTCELDSDRWLRTISKKKVHNPFKKYTFAVIIFVSGLLFVSALKNETRNLQKEIYNLKASINVLKFNLKQGILDHEVLTSPENISRLAKDHLNINLSSYQKSQIKILNTEYKFLPSKNTIKEKKKKNKNLQAAIKIEISQKIKEKKMALRKLEELYLNPKSIPDRTKKHLAKKIEDTKIEIKNMYDSPKDIVTFDKIRKWGAIQVVKVFLGIPVIPGR